MKKIAYFVKNFSNLPQEELGPSYVFVLGKIVQIPDTLNSQQIRFSTEENVQRMLIPGFFDEIYADFNSNIDLTPFVKNKSNLYKLGA